MSIFHPTIFELTKKHVLTSKDKLIIRNIQSRFSLEHFHFYRHDRKRGLVFDDIDYSRFSHDDLVQSCCADIH